MTKRPFRILYREFLFRVVDRELLSTHGTGDSHELFTQIAAVLIFLSFCVTFPALDRNAEWSATMRLLFAWRFEHFLIATTMLAVGLFAILSWGSMFPDHRDVLVLAPLPIRPRTILLAKLAAIVSALGLVVVSFHVVAGVIWPLALNRAAPPIPLPVFRFDRALPPVAVGELQLVLDHDLVDSRQDGWLSPRARGGVAIGVAQRGVRRIFTYGAARPDSIFQIGSLTKTFTGLVFARMVDDGRVRLDTRVRELIPAAGLPEPSDRGLGSDITLLDLVTHHSGLPPMPAPFRAADRADNTYADYGTENLYAFLRRHGVVRPANVPFVYSNLGFGLLGHALANRAQVDYATLIRQNVTGPLGLHDTVVTLSPQQQERLIQGFNEDRQPVPPSRSDALAGADALYSTAPDMLAWLEANLHPMIPLASAFEIAQQPRAAAGASGRIGFAWMIDSASGRIGHSGAVGGFTAEEFFNRADDLAVIVLSNLGSGVVAPASLVVDHIRARLAGAPAIALGEVVVPSTGSAHSWLRLAVAYWLTMLAASVFVVGLLMGVQGVAAALLPRRYFLRSSSLLQLASFVGLVSGYLLQTIAVSNDSLVAAQSGGLFSSSPSYWFLGLFQAMNGSDALAPLAERALTGTALVMLVAIIAYCVSYVRTLRGIAEEPDITASAVHVRAIPGAGHGPRRALVDFSLRTLARSAHPRMSMAFYWGLGFAFAVVFIKTPRGQELATASYGGAWDETSVPLLVSSILMMGAAIVAARSAFAMPRDLAANWIFRMVPIGDARSYGAARRWAMIAVTIVPVCGLSAGVLFSLWPWRPALEHVIALAWFGFTLVEIAESGTRTIPFACSYLPGRSRTHIAVAVVFAVILPLVLTATTFERDALRDARIGALMFGVLGSAWIAARWRTRWLASTDDLALAFDEEPADRVLTLELWDSRLPSASPNAKPAL